MGNPRPPIHWLSVLQFTLSALVGFLMLAGAGIIFFTSALQQLSGLTTTSDTLLGFILAANLTLLGVLGLIVSASASARLLGRRIGLPAWINLRTLGFGVFLVPVAILIGALIANIPAINWFLLPPFHLIAVGLPVLWALSIGARNLQSGSLQRKWGLLGSGLFFGPALIIFLELVVGIFFLAIVIGLLLDNPGFFVQLERLALRFQAGRPPNPDTLLQFAQDYLLEPGIVTVGVLYIAVFVPILEEALKPIGMWFLRRKNLTPAEGFIAGLISGAGFALFESLFQFTDASSWALLVTARIGTTIVHMLNSGLVGWGLAVFWQDRKLGRLLINFSLAVLIHGAWNGISIAFAISSISDLGENFPWGAIAGIGLPGLAG